MKTPDRWIAISYEENGNQVDRILSSWYGSNEIDMSSNIMIIGTSSIDSYTVIDENLNTYNLYKNRVGMTALAQVEFNNFDKIHKTKAYTLDEFIEFFIKTDKYTEFERNKWEYLAACMYQAAGAYNLPLRFMDVLAAAMNGEEFVHLLDDLLPVSNDEPGVWDK